LNASKLYIVPIELADVSVIDPLFIILAQEFNLQTALYRKQIDLKKAYNAQRNQYYSTEILAQIIANPPPDAFRILGVVGPDIYIPVLTFLYGEAQFKGTGALLSIHRLYPDFYGQKDDAHLFLQRLIKEAIHELGHTYGLPHCDHPECVMRSSTYIEDVDEKSASFCKSCAERLASFTL
jgi:archaemetzincin